MKISLVVAYSNSGVIGKDNKLPWANISTDMKHFKWLTESGWKAVESFYSKSPIFKNRHPYLLNNGVVMGRKTYESIPERFRPLPNRFNIVLSRTLNCGGMPFVVRTFEGIEYLQDELNLNEIFVIGGSEIYKLFIEKYPNMISNIYVTRIYGDYDGDCYFPEVSRELVAESCYINENNVKYRFLKYEKR